MRSRPLIILLISALLIPGTAEGRPPRRARFEAPPGGSLLVHGTYPPVESRCVAPAQPLLHARYRGSVEVGLAGDGRLFVIGELPFEDYLKGIAEVPRSWPMEALKAQVVAARSYAMVRLSRPSDAGRDLGYDLCATDACQVYLGMGVEAGPYGERWQRAVEQTAGEVLLYRGEPAETFYSSTSPGRTYDVEDVFGGEPRPYLRGIRERDDGESPLSRWVMRMPFADLARFLEEARRWEGGAIRRITDDGEHIRIRGADRAVLHRDELREALNTWARCLSPDRYPTVEQGGSRLPQTVPSVWYRARQEGDSIELRGRGWGHAVGMVQWGAKGKADRGLGYDDILAAYYGGLRPQRVSVPGTIRVLVAEGLESVAVVPTGDAEVRWRGRVPDPPWRVSAGRKLRLRHGSAPAPLLSASGFSARRKATAGRAYAATLSISRNARVRLEFVRKGERVAATAWRPFPVGAVTYRARAPEVPRGRYAVRAAVTDGTDVLTTSAVRVRVRGPKATPSPSPSPSPTRTPSPTGTVAAAPARGGGAGPVLLATTALVVLAAAILLTVARRRRVHWK